jgi:hypothetical protein
VLGLVDVRVDVLPECTTQIVTAVAQQHEVEPDGEGLAVAGGMKVAVLKEPVP